MAEGVAGSPEGGLKVSSSSVQDVRFRAISLRRGQRIPLPERRRPAAAAACARRAGGAGSHVRARWSRSRRCSTRCGRTPTSPTRRSPRPSACCDRRSATSRSEATTSRRFRGAAIASSRGWNAREATDVPGEPGAPVEDGAVDAVAALGPGGRWRHPDDLGGLEPAPAARRRRARRSRASASRCPTGFHVADDRPALAFAPDSSAIAFVASRAGEPPVLFLRSLADAESRPLAGTEGAEAPFFSPDGRSIGYFAHGQLWRLEVDGGEPRAIAAAPSPAGGASGPETTSSCFAARWGEGLRRVASTGGAPRVTTRIDRATGEGRHAWPNVDAGTGLLMFSNVRLSDQGGRLTCTRGRHRRCARRRCWITRRFRACCRRTNCSRGGCRGPWW